MQNIIPNSSEEIFELFSHWVNSVSKWFGEEEKMESVENVNDVGFNLIRMFCKRILQCSRSAYSVGLKISWLIHLIHPVKSEWNKKKT